MRPPKHSISTGLGTRGAGFGDLEPGFQNDLDPTSEGSNNWAISPRRTATGRPLLANNPHRTQAVPSLRYIVHLSSPDLDLIGAGEPALPGISIGHNGTIAFGLTIFSIDQEDLYVYRTKPGDPDFYEYRGDWLPMDVIEETIPVRGGTAQSVEHRFTRHGPVLYQDPTATWPWACEPPGSSPAWRPISDRSSTSGRATGTSSWPR